MKVLVVGASGMLGHKLCQVLGERFETWGTVRSDASTYEGLGLLEPGHLIGGVDATDQGALAQVVDRVGPDAIVNAVGIIKQLPEAKDPVTSISLNSLEPHRLAAIGRASNARLVHVSTDCVFSGGDGMYSEDDLPDARDLYGRSKLLGEVDGPGSVTLRTSIIGRELVSSNGLVEWFLGNAGGAVDGYRKSIFSGLPTLILARVVADVIENHPELEGLFHVSVEPIAKLDLLQLLKDAYRVEVDIRATDGVEIDRSLDSSRFRSATGFSPPPWKQLVEEMAGDPTPYETWRHSA